MGVPNLLAGAALLALAAACRPEPREEGRVVTGSGPDTLALELLLPRSVRAGEPVPMTLRVQNRTARTLDLYLRGRSPTFDVVVARPDGEVVWRRLEGEIIPAIALLRPLAPGERLEIAASWDQRTGRGLITPGNYTARGLLLTEGEPLETADVPFTVAGR